MSFGANTGQGPDLIWFAGEEPSGMASDCVCTKRVCECGWRRGLQGGGTLPTPSRSVRRGRGKNRGTWIHFFFHESFVVVLRDEVILMLPRLIWSLAALPYLLRYWDYRCVSYRTT